MKQSLFAILFTALLSICAEAQAQPQTRPFTLTWQDNSKTEADAEDGFKLYRKNADGSFALLGQVGANVTTFVTPAITAAEGAQVCFAVSAFNKIGESGKAEGCGAMPVTAVAVLPLDMHGKVLPEYKALEVTLTKPAGATRAILILEVYDPDFPDEGDLYVNNNGPVALFGAAGNSANQQKVATVEFDLPLAWLVNGVNRLRFGHSKTDGYRIDKAAVRFDLATPPAIPGAPSALTVKVQ